MGKMFEDLKQGLIEIDAYLAGEGDDYKVTVSAAG